MFADDRRCSASTCPGVTVALLDTAIPDSASGRVTADQLDELDDLAADARRAPCSCSATTIRGIRRPHERPDSYFGINPDDSEAPGRGHRPPTRTSAATSPATPTATGSAASPPPATCPYVEVACVKDYPGAWAEYEVYEGGIVQLHHRISTPEALDWTERTRAMFFGAYPEYSFGDLDDRCFVIPTAR